MPVILRKTHEGFRFTDTFESTTRVNLGSPWVVDLGDVFKENGLAVVFEGGDTGYTVSRLNTLLPTGFVRLGYVHGGLGAGKSVLFNYSHATQDGYIFSGTVGLSKIVAGVPSVLGGAVDTELPGKTFDESATNVAWGSNVQRVIVGGIGFDSRLKEYADSDYDTGFVGMAGRYAGVGMFPTNLVNEDFQYYENEYVTVTGLEAGWKVRLYYNWPVDPFYQYIELIAAGASVTFDILPYQFATFPFFLVSVLDADDIRLFDYEYPVYPGDQLELIDVQDLPFPRVDSEVTPAWREFQEEMVVPGISLLAASVTARPDALSRDFKTAYSLGPIAIGDPTEGLQFRLWRVQFRAPSFYVAYEQDGAWVGESFLFAHATEAFELDLTFEQNGRPVVSWSDVNLNIWLYWYDPLTPGFISTNFAQGRSPRLVLDNPIDVTNSDVLLFYVRDDLDRVVYREQRDRYAVEYKTGIIRVQNLYLARIRFTRNYRIQIAYFLHYPVLGKWTFGFLPSALYNVPSGPDELVLNHAGVSASNVFVMWVYESPALDGLDLDHMAMYIANYDPLIQPVLPIEGLDLSHDAVTIGNPVVLFFYESPPLDGLDLSHDAVTITLVLVVIVYATPHEGLDLSHDAVTITNVP